MFDGTPSYGRTRNLKLGCVGEDVYALQKALHSIGLISGTADGSFGPVTLKAVLDAQRRYRLDADGIAGGATQAKLASTICLKAAAAYALPKGLLYGQTGHESGHRLGIYSWIIRADGSYDAGLTQLNTEHYAPILGFDPAFGVDELAKRLTLYFGLYQGLPVHRRWELASGAWNAPAYASWIARHEGSSVPMSYCLEPSPAARATLEAYIDSATALMVL